MSFLLGLDLGQARDYTALVVIEKGDGGGSPRYDIRHLRRFLIGTPYPAIVDEVKDLLLRPPLRAYAPLVVNAVQKPHNSEKTLVK